MRVLIICAIVITGAVGLSGCFHHEKAVTQEPLKLGKLNRRSDARYSIFSCTISRQMPSSVELYSTEAFIVRGAGTCGAMNPIQT